MSKRGRSHLASGEQGPQKPHDMGAHDLVSQLSGAFTATTSFELHGHPDKQLWQTQLSSDR